MKILILSLVGLSLLALTGCETKVVNEPAARGQPTVVEHDRPVVVQQEGQPQKPEVQNNIHVDRP